VPAAPGAGPVAVGARFAAGARRAGERSHPAGATGGAGVAGLITLVGLVAKNGILIVEFANQLQRTGLDKARAVTEAAATRLRPILITTAATAFGHMPLIFARGPGAGARNSIGITLVSGMIIGTAFTLFVVRAIYTVVAKAHQRDEVRDAVGSEGSPIADAVTA